ncbi:fibroblast growth factor 21 isoform X1 [Etheostoma spectabile]|uniref:fibroblast growth factor 21 isoform X1 n=1 Tax=Etheostoma spectabile TaxID=54343 RepID=UPI0013AEAD47|nr:fibroblast growth factor 21-like isoform X1 [Etheostoma spectabile]
MFLFPYTSFSCLSCFLLIIPLPFSLSFYLTDSNPLLSFDNQVREVHLYTDNHRRAMYLQMTGDGKVSGSDTQTCYSVLELKSVNPGHIVIQGKSSSLFLCVDSGGHLRGQVRQAKTTHFPKVSIYPFVQGTVCICCSFQVQYSEADCTFRELLLADGYTRFLSSHHGFPMSLASRHSPDQHTVPFTRFLPLRNTLAGDSVSEQPPSNQRLFNVDSDDLFGMSLNTMVSPHFSVDK